jgi:acetyl esterase/lipase
VCYDSSKVNSRKAGLPRPAGAVLISPWVDLQDSGASDSWRRNVDIDYLPANLTRYFAECYKGGASWEQVSPLLFGDSDLAALPALLIECGECEVLHDQIVAFADKCSGLGVSVALNVRADMVHVFPLLCFTGVPQIADTFTAITTFVNTNAHIDIAVVPSDSRHSYYSESV